MALDFGKYMVWSLSQMKGTLPPYLLEIIMKDGRSYFVHSGISNDEQTQSVMINIWDLRAVDDQTEAEIKAALYDTIVNTTEGEEINFDVPSDLHPQLSIGRLRCKLDDIAHVVEWLAEGLDIESSFPREIRKQMGYLPEMPKNDY